jgi:carbonic anhydrase/acetyltransferase-like protein (isoleucine patch superfamily)
MALIEHGVFVGDFCHLSTRITINGDCVLGKNIFIGSGSAISNQINIGDDVIVGMGSVVLKEIGNNKKVIGLWN